MKGFFGQLDLILLIIFHLFLDVLDLFDSVCVEGEDKLSKEVCIEDLKTLHLDQVVFQ